MEYIPHFDKTEEIIAGSIVPTRSVKIPLPTCGFDKISCLLLICVLLFDILFISFCIGDSKILIDFFLDNDNGILSCIRFAQHNL